MLFLHSFYRKQWAILEGNSAGNIDQETFEFLLTRNFSIKNILNFGLLFSNDFCETHVDRLSEFLCVCLSFHKLCLWLNCVFSYLKCKHIECIHIDNETTCFTIYSTLCKLYIVRVQTLATNDCMIKKIPQP